MTPVKWNEVRGIPNVPASDTGTYIWTVSVANLACTTTSSGTIRVIAQNRPVMNPNPEETIDGQLYVADHEGNAYKTVQIGSQTWMAENMRCTTSPTNVQGWTKLPGAPGGSDYTPYYADPHNGCYGLLYNWAGAMDILTGNGHIQLTSNKGICPSGWHVPTEEDWCALQLTVENDVNANYCDAADLADKRPAYVGTIGSRLASNSPLWYACSGENTPGNYANNSNQNSSGFSAFPAGRYLNGESGQTVYAYFWTSTQYPVWANGFCAMYRLLEYDRQAVYKSYPHKYFAFSVRCVKD